MRRLRSFLSIIADGARSAAAVRLALVTLALMTVATPWIIWGATCGLQTMFNAPLYWIPRDSESRQQFNEFLRLFHSHEMVLVSWPGCTVDDAQLATVADSLEATRHARLADGQEELFSQVWTGYTMLQMLVDDPISLHRVEALDRLRGVLVGPDNSTSCLVVEVTDYGAEHRREAIQIIADVVTETTGWARESLIFAGPPVDGIAIDDESIRMIEAFSLPSFVISLIACWLCLRSLWLTLSIVIVGAFSEGLMLALIYFGGLPLNAILIVLPPLVFVLSVSSGVHMANYFLDEISSDPGPGAPRRALRKGWIPCTLAAMTTAIGLASLSVSEVRPVQQFGILGAMGVIIGATLVFLLMPGFMTLWLRFPSSQNITARLAERDRAELCGRLAAIVSRHRAKIGVICVAVMLLCGIGLTRLRISIDIMSLLSSDNRAVRDFHWFEDNVGPLLPVEVIVHFDKGCDVPPVERLKLVGKVQQRIAEIGVLRGDMSAATFLPNYPEKAGFRATVQRNVVRRVLEESRDDLIQANYLAATETGESWRISARILGQHDFDYARFIERLQKQVDPIIEATRQAGCRGISATCTGLTAVEYDVQRVLLGDLFHSFLTALVLVALVMMLALRSITCGLLAMIPNIFPTIFLFGGLGAAGQTLDIGTVMTASVALGIAVDGTLHFLRWFVHSVNQGQTRVVAIAHSFQHCGRALIQTTIICSCGLLIFGFSGFLPARNFAWMLLFMLIAALVGDLVVLPSLLAGRLGKLLCRGGHCAVDGRSDPAEVTR